MAAVLVGRDEDLDFIAAFVDQAAESGGALLLSGEGKTVLLDAAAARAAAAGSRVLRAAGSHSIYVSQPAAVAAVITQAAALQ